MPIIINHLRIYFFQLPQSSVVQETEADFENDEDGPVRYIFIFT